MECTCCRCGKSFNYEKYYGICPKCAAYNRQPGMEPEDFDVEHDISARFDVDEDDSCARLHEQYDSAPSHRPHEQHMAYHKTYDQGNVHTGNMWTTSAPAKEKKSRSRSFVPMLLVFGAMIVLLVVAVFLSIHNAYLDVTGEAAADQVYVTEISGQSFSIQADRVIELGTNREISFVPQGERLVALHVTVDSDDSSEIGKIGAPILSYDGVYREAIDMLRFDDAELSEIGNADITDHILSKYRYTSETNDGFFLYLIPEETKGQADEYRVLFEKYRSEDSDNIEVQYIFQLSGLENLNVRMASEQEEEAV